MSTRSTPVDTGLDAAHVVISVLAADGHRFEWLAGGDAASQAPVTSADWTVDSDAPGPRDAFEPTWPSALGASRTTISLRAARVDTVIWATGFVRRYPWLRVPVFDEHGEIRHRAGVTPVPGLFVLGMHFQRSRKSAFIDGVGDDAALLAETIANHAAFAAAAS